MKNVNKQLLERWAAFSKAMQKAGSELPRHLIAETEQAIAAAEQAQQAEPVAWEVRNGFVTHDFYKTAEDAEEVARDMQKSHDLSGSIAAFNVRPVYAQPPAVAVPELRPVRRAQDGMPSANYAEGFDHGWNDCVYQMRAMLAAAQKGGQ